MNLYEHLDEIAAVHFGDKYSRNLWRWLRRARRRHWPSPQVFVQIGDGICRVASYDASKTQASAIYLGMPDNGDLFGSQLAEIITQGTKTRTWCFAGYTLPHRAQEITEDFWTRYIEHGKCAIDPEHKLYYPGDRYKQNGHVRACQWCGREEVAKIERRVEENLIWTQTGCAI